MEDKIELKFDSWKIKKIERSRDRMKLQIKFSKEEALALKNFLEMVKPPEISEDDFFKGIFKMGVETMETKLMEAVQEHIEENDLDPSAVGLEKVVDEEDDDDELQAS